MAEIKVTFGAIESAQADVSGTAGRMNSQLEDLKRFLAPMVATWEGQAATEYQAKQRQWDTAAAGLASVLQQIGVALGSRERELPSGRTGQRVTLALSAPGCPLRRGRGRFDPAPRRRVPWFFDVRRVDSRGRATTARTARPTGPAPQHAALVHQRQLPRADDSDEVGPCPRTAPSPARSPAPGT